MKEKTNRTYLLVILGMYLITFIIVSKNFFTPYLGYDEAGQFWMAKGLSHDSEPFASTNGLMGVIENNKYYNVDPGGFGILLHFWTYVSNHHVWLRLLPFLFFIGVVLSFIYLSYLWLKDINVALLMGFIPVFIPVVLSMGFEIRAYSMESMGTVISMVALERLKNKLTHKHLFLWSCVFSFFITSRYAEIVVIFTVSLYVLFFIVQSTSMLKQKIVSAIIYSVPLIATLLCIYYFALIYQNKNIEPFVYLRYLKSNIGILREPANFLSLCFIGILIVLFFLKNRYPIIKRYEILLLITISVHVLFITFAFLGIHPWDLSGDRSSRCISLFLLFGLCIAAFLGELLKPLFNSPDILKYYLIASLLIFTLYVTQERLLIRIHDKHMRNNSYFDFWKIDMSSFHRIYADRIEAPCIRYLFEYGALRSKKGTIYPNRFTFEKYGHHHSSEGIEVFNDYYKKCPKMNDLLEYDLLITPELYRHGNNDKWKPMDGTASFFIKKDTTD
jgi:hypothetical protein